ncbi:MAG: hypothetical protein GXY34_06480 [Syntrophomonadaceae bacterium]|nr:hypothetical protein [Syntrophomonadaceae bacterium]
MAKQRGVTAKDRVNMHGESPGPIGFKKLGETFASRKRGKGLFYFPGP